MQNPFKSIVFKSVQLLSICLLITSCVSPFVKNADDLKKSITVESGQPGCKGCERIKMITSGTIDSQLFSVRDSENKLTGQRVSASLALGASNRMVALSDGLNIKKADLPYVRSLTGNEGHLFEGQFDIDSNHPYRFLVIIHHNSSSAEQGAYFVSDDGNSFAHVPAITFEGSANTRHCFASGCVWDEYYALPAKEIVKLIESNQPLRIFVGSRISQQVSSKDGVNRSYETANSGVFLSVPADYLDGFLSHVRQTISR